MKRDVVADTENSLVTLAGGTHLAGVALALGETGAERVPGGRPRAGRLRVKATATPVAEDGDLQLLQRFGGR